MASSVRMLVMTSIRPLSMGSSLLRVWVVSMNLGNGHRGQESDEGWCGINSHGGVASASAVAVACMAVVAGWPLLQVTDRDPLGWALLPNAWLLWGLLGDGLH